MDDYQQVEVLLVEDNPHDAELTMRSLKKGQLLNKVHWVKDGQEALDYLNCTGPYAGRDVADHPRLILLDLKMPKVDGVEVLKRIKSDARLKSIPVVVMTSSSEPPDVLKCYQSGVNSYVVKPLELDEFMQAVSKIGMYWIMTYRAIQR
jgi:CheY-like chemotaxis protein